MESFSDKLIKWHKKSGRKNLPWQIDKSPYKVWISEIMLQQTQVTTVIPYFHKFIKKFPSISELANANEDEVLAAWSGLGYYSRARNLLKAAKLIKKNFGSKIPNSYDELMTLPGIGDYTAKAIIGIAYNSPVMPTDANIERILVRLFAIEKPIIKIKDKLKNLANTFVSKNSSSNLIQSFMDYGSSVCVPRNPKCNICKINNLCQSHKKNLQSLLPLKIKKTGKKNIKYTRAYVLINEQDEILVRNRPSKGMLASMLEVPNDNWVENKKLLSHDELISKLKTKLKHKGSIEYSFSHFNLETDIYFGNIKKNKLSQANWIKKTHYSKSGLPTVMKKIVEVAI